MVIYDLRYEQSKSSQSVSVGALAPYNHGLPFTGTENRAYVVGASAPYNLGLPLAGTEFTEIT